MHRNVSLESVEVIFDAESQPPVYIARRRFRHRRSPALPLATRSHLMRRQWRGADDGEDADEDDDGEDDDGDVDDEGGVDFCLLPDASLFRHVRDRAAAAAVACPCEDRVDAARRRRDDALAARRVAQERRDAQRTAAAAAAAQAQRDAARTRQFLLRLEQAATRRQCVLQARRDLQQRMQQPRAAAASDQCGTPPPPLPPAALLPPAATPIAGDAAAGSDGHVAATLHVDPARCVSPLLLAPSAAAAAAAAAAPPLNAAATASLFGFARRVAPLLQLLADAGLSEPPPDYTTAASSHDDEAAHTAGPLRRVSAVASGIPSSSAPSDCEGVSSASSASASAMSLLLRQRLSERAQEGSGVGSGSGGSPNHRCNSHHLHLSPAHVQAVLRADPFARCPHCRADSPHSAKCAANGSVRHKRRLLHAAKLLLSQIADAAAAASSSTSSTAGEGRGSEERAALASRPELLVFAFHAAACHRNASVERNTTRRQAAENGGDDDDGDGDEEEDQSVDGIACAVVNRLFDLHDSIALTVAATGEEGGGCSDRVLQPQLAACVAEQLSAFLAAWRRYVAASVATETPEQRAAALASASAVVAQLRAARRRFVEQLALFDAAPPSPSPSQTEPDAAQEARRAQMAALRREKVRDLLAGVDAEILAQCRAIRLVGGAAALETVLKSLP